MIQVFHGESSHVGIQIEMRIFVFLYVLFDVSTCLSTHTYTHKTQELSARRHPSQNAVAVSRYALTRTSPTDQYLADVQLCTGPSMLTSNFPNTAIICVIIIALLLLSPLIPWHDPLYRRVSSCRYCYIGDSCRLPTLIGRDRVTV